MTDKKNEVKTVWLANKTQRPIHIMQRGKDAEGNALDNIRLSTLGAVEVSEETLNLSGVAQLLKKKALVKVTEAQAKKLNKAHDTVVSQPDKQEEGVCACDNDEGRRGRQAGRQCTLFN